MIRTRVWVLLLLIALVSLPMGVAANRYHAQRRAVAELRRLGADVELEPGALGTWWPRVVGVEAHGRALTDEALAVLADLPDVRSLALIGTRTTDDGLARLAKLRRLEILDLEETEVTDAGLTHIARIRSLKELRIGGGRVTEDGLGRLKRASPGLKVEQGVFL